MATYLQVATFLLDFFQYPINHGLIGIYPVLFCILAHQLYYGARNFEGLVVFRESPTALRTIFRTTSASATFQIIAGITKRLPIFQIVCAASIAGDFVILLKSFIPRRTAADCTYSIVVTHNSGPLFIGKICARLFLLRNI